MFEGRFSNILAAQWSIMIPEVREYLHFCLTFHHPSESSELFYNISVDRLSFARTQLKIYVIVTAVLCSQPTLVSTV